MGKRQVVKEPQAFRVLPPLEALLALRSQQELIALIGEMLKRYPGLMSVVELTAAARLRPYALGCRLHNAGRPETP
jgi:hypothetical protein